MSKVSDILGSCTSCSATTPSQVTVTTKPEIQSITEVNGKVAVLLKDGSYMETELDVVDDSLHGLINQDDSEKIKELETKVKNLTESLVEIQGINGETSFKAVSKNFN